jgi:hypothetical protein
MRNLLRGGSTRARALLVVAVVGLASLIIIACGSGSAANTGTSVSGSPSSGTGSGGQPSAAQQHFKVGDQVKVGDADIVTVNSVKTSSGDEFDQPQAGNVYLIVDVTIKNISSQEQDISTILQFTLKDSTGQKYDQTIVSNATSPDGKLEPGDQVRGQLAYEVPQTQKSFTLAFEADFISSGQTIWDLSV